MSYGLLYGETFVEWLMDSTVYGKEKKVCLRQHTRNKNVEKGI